MKKIIYAIEAVLLGLLFKAFRLLPLDVSSAIGGWMARSIGPLLSAQQIAKQNLNAAFPDMDAKEKKRIITKMWDNLGRVAAEMSSLPGTRLTSRIKVIGAEHLPTPDKPVLFFSGHLGNWELLYPIAFDHGVPISIVYRHINNPFVDKMVSKIREGHCTSMFSKGPRSAAKMLRAIKNGNSMAMLVDQKMNTGIPVPFFGRDAMTASALAEIALKFNMPILPTRIVRTGGAHFEGYIYPPLDIVRTGDMRIDSKQIMTQINAILEGWIREHPEQWFWVHKRWPKEA